MYSREDARPVLRQMRQVRGPLPAVLPKLPGEGAFGRHYFLLPDSPPASGTLSLQPSFSVNNKDAQMSSFRLFQLSQLPFNQPCFG
jgi:hypothetical protein